MRRPWVEKGGRRKKKECFSNASECNFANLRLFVKSKNFVVFSQNEFLQTDVFNYVWIDEINCLTVACAFSRQNEFVSFWPPFLILQCCHIDGRRPAVAFQQAPCCAGANRVPVRSGSRRGKPGAGLLMQFLAHCTFRQSAPKPSVIWGISSTVSSGKTGVALIMESAAAFLYSDINFPVLSTTQ